MTFLCPLYREYLIQHLDKAFQQVKKYQDLSEEYYQTGNYNDAFHQAGKALEATELVLFHKTGWSVPALIQYTSSAIHFCRLLKGRGVSTAVLTNQYCTQQLQQIIAMHDLSRLSWAQECLQALTLQHEQMLNESKTKMFEFEAIGEKKYVDSTFQTQFRSSQGVH